MNLRITRRLLIGTLAVALAACGGGGGGDGDSATTNPPPTSFPSALDFEHPSSFSNGDPHFTDKSVTAIRGELNSVFIPRGFCPDSQPPQNFTVRWTNSANRRSGTVPVGIGCVTIIVAGAPVPGIASSFVIDNVDLELGNNQIIFETFEGGTQIGRDGVLIVHEDRVAPKLLISYPANGQQDIPTNHSLVVIFSEPMDAASLTSGRFLLADATGAAVAGQVDYDVDDQAWQFRPDAPLVTGSRYNVTVNGDVKDAGGGNTLGSDFSWSFETGTATDIAAPIIQKSWPGSNCDCAPVSTRILASLNEFIDPQSLDDSDMTVTSSGAVIDGTIIYRGDYLEFIPNEPLTAGLTYTASVSAGMRDLAGQQMQADYSWLFTTDVRPVVGAWSETSGDQPPPAMSSATAVWSGNEVLLWGPAGAGRYNPANDSWNSGSGLSVGGPSSRVDHSAVWTGTEMVVWGGHAFVTADSEIFGGGSVYNLAADTWVDIVSPASATSFPTYDHVAVWTGTEIIVWGGMASSGSSPSPRPVNSGWRYDPATDTVVAFTGIDAPSPRSKPVAVWTGTEMIVWGGVDETGTPLNDGARYNPVTDTWTALPPVGNSLVPGLAITTVWTGTEVIVWNGGKTESDQTLNDQFREPTLHFYDPAMDTWRVSTSGWEPFLAAADPFVMNFFASGYFAFWTGDRMFVAGRYPGDRSYLYDPNFDSWQVVSDVLGLSRKGAASVWAGSRFVYWGGVISVLPTDEGLVFEP